MLPSKAFILGAGLGTRLKPLTNNIPKPLIPIQNKELIKYSIEHLKNELNIHDIIINTHHCHQEYSKCFKDNCYKNINLNFMYEKTLLDTGGGLKNIASFFNKDDNFIVYNGDLLTNLNLREAWQEHIKSDNIVTLLLRKEGYELNVGMDPLTKSIVDFRSTLISNWDHLYQFTGIYFVNSYIFKLIKKNKVESIINTFLKLIKLKDRIKGFVINEGVWSDIGNINKYIESLGLISKISSNSKIRSGNRVEKNLNLSNSSTIDSISWIGKNVIIEDNVKISRSIIWDNSVVSKNSNIKNSVIIQNKVITT